MAGILIGYFFFPHKPKSTPPHHFTFDILPGGVLAAPYKGDVLEWYKDGKPSDEVHIHFYGDSPCEEGDGGNKCTITEAAVRDPNHPSILNQFMYFCSDKANANDPSATILCQDPGAEPTSGGDGKLQLPGENHVVYAAQQSKSPQPRSPEPSQPAPDVQIAPTNLTVVCRNNTVQVLNPSTTPPNTDTPIVKVGGLVQWNSTLNPTIKMDASKCEADTLGNHPPTCTVKSAGDISYTVQVDKCANAAPATFHINVRELIKGCDFF
ncbi:hypothetical protein [Edaphobacter aggregans]|uniref:hypothetical protein n=1 Tax=Edaphobacter aggregans TaxID=570835 RepID=UPI0005551995|nr:hypothetical protein [Edaphobacter aggregans]